MWIIHSSLYIIYHVMALASIAPLFYVTRWDDPLCCQQMSHSIDLFLYHLHFTHGAVLILHCIIPVIYSTQATWGDLKMLHEDAACQRQPVECATICCLQLEFRFRILSSTQRINRHPCESESHLSSNAEQHVDLPIWSTQCCPCMHDTKSVTIRRSVIRHLKC